MEEFRNLAETLLKLADRLAPDFGKEYNAFYHGSSVAYSSSAANILALVERLEAQEDDGACCGGSCPHCS